MNTRKIFVRVGSVSLVVLLMAAAYPTQEDKAPPAKLPGANLGPAPEDNLRVEWVMPAVWQKVLKEQAILAENPQDGEAWGRLGKLYKAIIDDHSSE